jgi:hypothetical protein
MITINALGKNRQSILPDLDGASPTGGEVRTENRPRYSLAPGDVVRDGQASGGQWSVVADVRHNGILGISTVGLIRADGTSAVWVLTFTDVANVRTDTRIDPDTLWQIAPEPAAPRELVTS